MRSLPVMLSIALALTTLTACDKKADEGKDKAGDTKEKADSKAETKKTGEEVSANTAEHEEGCLHGDEDKDKDHDHALASSGHSCDHAAAPSESTGHFGAEFAVAETTSLSAALANGVPTEAIKVSGTVNEVCQKMGCWMTMQDGEVSARVLIKDHAFAIPKDGKGKSAIVEGTVELKELTEANVAHLKKDGDASLEGDEGRQEYVLHATAIELAANS